MTKNRFIPVLLGALFLASCACSPGSGSSSSSATPSSDSSTTSGGEASTIESSEDTSVDSQDYYTEFVVTFHTYEGNTFTENVAPKSKVARPADPVREGYTFVDWYWDEVCVTPFNFDLRIYAPTDVYAGWKKGSAPVVSSSEESSSQEEVTSSEGEGIQLTITFTETWVLDNDPTILSWTWTAGSSGVWGEVDSLAQGEIKLTVAEDVAGVILVRFPGSVNLSNAEWKTAWNKTNDINIESGVTTYATKWVSAN